MNDLTPDEEDAKCKKRLERLEQNRISARESRKRKKTLIEELQRTVISLSRENKDLNERKLLADCKNGIHFDFGTYSLNVMDKKVQSLLHKQFPLSVKGLLRRGISVALIFSI